MKLQIQVPLTKAELQIDYDSRLLLLGSCFSENIGAKFDYYKFQVLRNPFGILFHPHAIENLITRAIHQQEYTEEEVFYLNERWHCFDAHSDVSSASQEQLVDTLNKALQDTLESLRHSTHVIITLGTAWVYRHLKSGKAVANCHKVPQTTFSKELLGVEEIEASLKTMRSLLHSVNASAQVIFTVSPVRHLKDGFVKNQWSKANLISAIHRNLTFSVETQGASPSEVKGVYFPSYEIMMDELRDYRFYASDMIHPSETAIAYIWERFRQSYISESTYELMGEVDAIQKGLVHRPFNEESQSHQLFLRKLGNKIEELQKRHPAIKFD